MRTSKIATWRTVPLLLAAAGAAIATLAPAGAHADRRPPFGNDPGMLETRVREDVERRISPLLEQMAPGQADLGYVDVRVNRPTALATGSNPGFEDLGPGADYVAERIEINLQLDSKLPADFRNNLKALIKGKLESIAVPVDIKDHVFAYPTPRPQPPQQREPPPYYPAAAATKGGAAGSHTGTGAGPTAAACARAHRMADLGGRAAGGDRCAASRRPGADGVHRRRAPARPRGSRARHRRHRRQGRSCARGARATGDGPPARGAARPGRGSPAGAPRSRRAAGAERARQGGAHRGVGRPHRRRRPA